jgi:diketogulonate reductase-like aldo/keto reductase
VAETRAPSREVRETERMQTRRLGRTGHHSSLAILGGAAFWDSTPAETEAALALALERGVNHLDIAPSYGRAEELVGALLPGVRHRLFIGCKTTRRSGEGARAQLEESLGRLGCDRFELYQAHAVTDLQVLDERAGAIEAMLRARDEGLCDWVGITGHDLGAPRAHLEALRRWDLDTVMFPLYPRVWADPTYRAEALELLAECARRDVGVMVIKAVAWRPWGPDETRVGPWYRPHADPTGIARGVRFALSVPGVAGFCTPGDAGLLPAVLDAAVAFEPMDDDERETVTRDTASDEIIFPLAEKARS